MNILCKKEILYTLFFIHANYWADWALSLCSTVPEVSDGVLDHVGPRHLKNMRTKGKKRNEQITHGLAKKRPSKN